MLVILLLQPDEEIHFTNSKVFETKSMGSINSTFCPTKTGVALYNKVDEEDEPSLQLYSDTGTGILMNSWKAGICDHGKMATNIQIRLLEVDLENKSYLLLSCSECSDKIFSLDYDNGQIETKFKRGPRDPFIGFMSHGPPGTILVADNTSGSESIAQFGLPDFAVMREMQAGTKPREPIRCQCYAKVNGNEGRIVITTEGTVRCIDMDSTEKVWEHSEIQGKSIDPWDVCWDERGSIIVNDLMKENGIMVLDAKTGDVKCFIEKQKYGNIYGFGFISQIIALYGYPRERQKVVYFNVEYMGGPGNMSQPQQSIAYAPQSISQPELQQHISQPQQYIPQPQQNIPQPQHNIPQPQQNIPQPQHNISQPQQHIPQPQQNISQPQQNLSYPQEGGLSQQQQQNIAIAKQNISPSQQHTTSYPTQSLSKPQQNIPYVPQSSSYAPQSTSYAPQSTSYAPQSTSYAPQSASHPQQTSYHQQNVSYPSQSSSYSQQSTSYSQRSTSYSQQSTPFPQQSISRSHQNAYYPSQPSNQQNITTITIG